MKTEDRMLHTQQRKTIILWVINELKERNECLKNDKKVCEKERKDNTHTHTHETWPLTLCPSSIHDQTEKREKWKMIRERQHAWISYQTWSSRWFPSPQNRVRRKVNIHYSPVDVVVSPNSSYFPYNTNHFYDTLFQQSLSYPKILYQISPSERQNRQEIVIISSRELLSLCFISNRSRQQSSSTLSCLSSHYHFWSTQNKQRIVIAIIPSCHFASSSLHHPHPHHQSLKTRQESKTVKVHTFLISWW